MPPLANVPNCPVLTPTPVPMPTSDGTWNARPVPTSTVELFVKLGPAWHEAQAARVSGHLRDCAACAADLRTLKNTIDILRGLPSYTASDALRQRLLAIPDAEQAAQRGPNGS